MSVSPSGASVSSGACVIGFEDSTGTASATASPACSGGSAPEAA